ncbi:hypothetical protein EJ02DRAFT_432817 [Clathrospora elynae]|uniref:Uncharacterized protein n=1 Tax=Clathrospora elynae TaxID=706981 RepID=A0A6A5T442_9PLEO|nr:hypothetical protein EJ02DRAFT_432817 [Clathrospora elynae]
MAAELDGQAVYPGPASFELTAGWHPSELSSQQRVPSELFTPNYETPDPLATYQPPTSDHQSPSRSPQHLLYRPNPSEFSSTEVAKLHSHTDRDTEQDRQRQLWMATTLDTELNHTTTSNSWTATARRRLSPIAQEFLLRKAVLSQEHIWKLVDRLREHLRLRKTLTHLRFGRMTQEVHNAMEMYANDRYAGLEREEKASYREVETDAHSPGSRNFIKTDFISDGLALILSPLICLWKMFLGANSIDSLPVLECVLRTDGDLFIAESSK